MTELYSVVPLSPLRKVIAARMTEAKQTIPHFRLVEEVEMDALLARREQGNDADSKRRISINDCVIKACATALMAHPNVNVQLIGNEIHRYHVADISVVIAVEGGLAMPILRAANRMSVYDIGEQMRALAARAAARQLTMKEIMGGSFSISNLGGFGVDQFDAIINPPQCAIIAIGQAKPRMTVSELGVARVAKVLKATLSVDHRAIDGATAAAFMTTLRQLMEQPQELFRIG